MMKPTKEQAMERLQKALDEIPRVGRGNYESSEFQIWFRNVRVTLRNIFGEHSSQYVDFAGIKFSPGVSDIRTGLEDIVMFDNGIRTAAGFLKSMLEEIEEDWESNASTEELTATKSGNQAIITNQVFVVHGRDDGTKETVARYLERLELAPIILHEQPDMGRTVIEKFEQYANVEYAVIVCTPDDVGALADETDKLRFRPRQNVVLEWGFFLGKLGRDSVFALIKGDDIEIPSDYAGVIYTKMDDDGAWRMELAGRLRSAGLPVDANRLLPVVP